MARIHPLDAGTRIPARGRSYLYVFPCGWEDLCKLGISRDPLARLQALHPRWFAFFDLERGHLVELDRVRDARDLELTLGHALAEHRAVAPITVRVAAGGHTEWYRGAGAALDAMMAALGAEGHVVQPLRPWLCSALEARSDRLFDWAEAMLDVDVLEAGVGATPAERAVRDALDACAALDIDVATRVSERVMDWYRHL